MSFALHIAFRNMEVSPAAETLVRQRADELQHFASRISACRVVMDCVHRQNHVGRQYFVHIDLTLPGSTIVVNRDGGNDHVHDDLQVAIRDAFDSARRQLQDHAHRQDGAARRHAAI